MPLERNDVPQGSKAASRGTYLSTPEAPRGPPTASPATHLGNITSCKISLRKNTLAWQDDMKPGRSRHAFRLKFGETPMGVCSKTSARPGADMHRRSLRNDVRLPRHARSGVGPLFPGCLSRPPVPRQRCWGRHAKGPCAETIARPATAVRRLSIHSIYRGPRRVRGAGGAPRACCPSVPTRSPSTTKFGRTALGVARNNRRPNRRPYVPARFP